MKALLGMNSKGMSIIDVMVAMGIAGIIATMLGGALMQSFRNQSKDNERISALAARNFIYRTLNQWQSFRATLIENASQFACALENTGCPPGVNTTGFRLAVMNSDGLPDGVYDGIALAAVPHGFDQNGAVCNLTSVSSGLPQPNAECPVRADFQWEPLCTSGCTDPVAIRITVKFRVYDQISNTVRETGDEISLLKSVHARKCTTPWETIVDDGTTFTAYDSDAAPCNAVTRECIDTQLDNQYAYTYQSCQCETPWGTQVPIGSSVTAYQAPSGASCTSQIRTCSAAGGLSGSYQYQSCARDCTLPWGGTITSGTTVQAWLTSSGTCTSENRTCTDSVLSGSYTFQTCTNAPCTAPWGASVAHGASVTAYRYIRQSPSCTSSESRVCNNGLLSGTYTNQTCVPCGGTAYPLCTSSTGCNSYCWYLGALGDTCTNTCLLASAGACETPGMVAYGSSGTNTTCHAVAQYVFSSTVAFNQDNDDNSAAGCVLDVGSSQTRAERKYRNVTTCEQNPSGDIRRFCTCAD